MMAVNTIAAVRREMAEQRVEMARRCGALGKCIAKGHDGHITSLTHGAQGTFFIERRCARCGHTERQLVDDFEHPKEYKKLLRVRHILGV